jgi:hypothetical protein
MNMHAAGHERPPIHLLAEESDMIGHLALQSEQRQPVVAAMLLEEIERAELHDADTIPAGAWVENSHLSFRRRERAMLRFRRMACLQKFASVHANVHNHFNSERHLVDRSTFKQRRSAALAEWQSLFS